MRNINPSRNWGEDHFQQQGDLQLQELTDRITTCHVFRIQTLFDMCRRRGILELPELIGAVKHVSEKD